MHCGRQLGLIALGAASLLTGCALLHPVASMKQTMGSPPALDLDGTVAPNANQDNVVDLDVVVVRNGSSLKQIEKMDAAAWFGPKGRCTFLGLPGDKVVFHSWEFAPGQSFYVHVVTGTDPKAVFAFADYPPPGPHRIVLDKSGIQMLELASAGLHTVAKEAARPTEQAAPEVPNVCPDN